MPNSDETHVGSDLVDLIEGRLTPDRRVEVSDHLAHCSDCAQDLAWVQQILEVVTARGLRHLSPDRMVFLAENEAELPTASEQVHLASCHSCREELEWASQLPPLALAGEATITVPGADAPLLAGRKVIERALEQLAASGAEADEIALSALSRAIHFFASLRQGAIDLDRLRSLAGPELLPVRIMRSVESSGELERERLLGLEAYDSGDFARAALHLTRAIALAPDDAELLLYLGSARRQLDDRAATEPLRKALAAATEPFLVAESRWQLASLHLEAGDPRAAVIELLEIVRSRGHRAEEAAALLARLMELAPPGP